jgi:hypothetical protein
LINGVLPVLNKTCFVAGTPVLTPTGETEIDKLRVGDFVLSRNEDKPKGCLRPQAIERVFELSAPIVEIRINGQTIETTAEHPFYVDGKGWVRAGELEPGDRLIGHTDQTVSIDAVIDTGRSEAVFNIRIAEDHTYFVGRESWGFSVWVHNAYSIRRVADGTWEVLDDAGTVVRTGLTGNAADAIRKNADGLTEAMKRWPDAQAMDISKLANLGGAGGRDFFDPAKLERLGKWDWRKFDHPIEIELSNGIYRVSGGLTRIQAALRAGVWALPVRITKL